LYAYFSAMFIVLSFELLDGREHLSYLICLCFAVIVLYVYARVTLPRGFVYAMRPTALTTRSEEVFTDPAKVDEVDAIWVLGHVAEYVVNVWHRNIIALLILLYKEVPYEKSDVSLFGEVESPSR